MKLRTRIELVEATRRLAKCRRPQKGDRTVKNFLRLAVVLNVATALGCWWLGWDNAAQVHATCAAVLSLLSA